MRLMVYRLFVLFFFVCISSCSDSPEKNERSESPMKGLLTVTESGITYMTCDRENRYRILDVDHKVNEAMLDHPLRLDEPFYAELFGPVSKHEGRLEFDRRFKEKIEVVKVQTIEQDIPQNCRHLLKPILKFHSRNGEWSVTVNHFVPAVIYARPKTGKLLYFPLDDNQFPDIERESNHLKLSSHGHEIEITLSKGECTYEESGGSYSHSIEMILDGEKFNACGGVFKSFI